MNSNHFERFETAIRRHVGGGDLGNLELARQGNFVTYYAPFDAINAAAKVVLVGITPGITQAQNALVAARRALETGATPEEALLAGKRTGAFSGPLRANLVDLLDRIELNAALGITSCGSLFDTDAYLLHTTSILPFPVLKAGANYDGKPFPLDVPFLAEQVERHFVPQARILRDAVFVPLGPVPAAVLKSLSQRGLVDERRVLEGLPHPSPANRERIDYFMGRKAKERLSAKTNPESLDRALARLLAATRALRDGGNATSESASNFPPSKAISAKTPYAPVAKVKPPGEPSKDATRSQPLHEVRAVAAVFGIRPSHETVKMVEFIGGALQHPFYVAADLSSPNAIKMYAHPSTDIGRFNGIAGISTSVGRSSNLRSFPRAMDQGVRKSPHGIRIDILSASALREVLRALIR